MAISCFLIRCVDVVVAILVLFLLLPVWFFIVPTLLFTGEGDVFYRQRRVGRGGRMFDLLKFATMVRNSSEIGSGEITLRNDPRVLPFGRFLRKTKLNEFPQFLNVLRGDMSLVGWRPQTKKYFEAYSRDVQGALARLSPGLSGIGSIIFRDEETILSAAVDPVAFDMDIIVPYKGRLEAWYAEKANFITYLIIIVMTGWVIFFPHSKLIWIVFKDLPAPPEELRAALGFFDK